MKEQVIVIGAGASGLMAAYAAASAGASVTLLEKNEKAGKKIYITGKGRCNLTNACSDEVFFASVCRNSRFLYSSYSRFDNRAMMELMEKNGCRLKTERGCRVFPASDHASDVSGCFLRLLSALGVPIKLNTEVREIRCSEDGGFELSCRDAVSGKQRNYHAGKLIVCTGGLSYPSTGSTGDGYAFAERMGHRLTERRPSLVPLRLAEDTSGLRGVSLKNVGLSLWSLKGRKKLLYEDIGEMLFTGNGISGPLVLTASAFLNGDVGMDDYSVSIDLKPGLNHEQLERRILRDFDASRNMDIGNALTGLLINAMIPVVLKAAGIDRSKKVHDISREERAGLVHAVKELNWRVTGRGGFEEAVITKGGVDVKDINPATMESKLIKGLYFAGEVLDLDAFTGGFNLQIAWTTGHAAGESAARACTEAGD